MPALQHTGLFVSCQGSSSEGLADGQLSLAALQFLVTKINWKIQASSNTLNLVTELDHFLSSPNILEP